MNGSSEIHALIAGGPLQPLVETSPMKPGHFLKFTAALVFFTEKFINSRRLVAQKLSLFSHHCNTRPRRTLFQFQNIE